MACAATRRMVGQTTARHAGPVSRLLVLVYRYQFGVWSKIIIYFTKFEFSNKVAICVQRYEII